MHVAASIVVNTDNDPAPNAGSRRRERFIRLVERDISANILMGVALPTGDAAFTIYGVGLDVTQQLPDDLDSLDVYAINPTLQSGVLAAAVSSPVLAYYAPGWYYVQVGTADSSVKRLDFMPANLGTSLTS
jgi:hypothetical protein